MISVQFKLVSLVLFLRQGTRENSNPGSILTKTSVKATSHVFLRAYAMPG